MIFLIRKFRRSDVGLVLVLMFFSGLAGYLGKSVENPYKILMLVLTVYLALKYKSFKFTTVREITLLIFFILFSISFITSSFYNKDPFTLIFSQYAKFLVPFLFLSIFSKFSKRNSYRINTINVVLLHLLLAQIILSAAKLIIFGGVETIVGSISYIGGALATLLPIVGFIYIWLLREGKMSRMDWILIIGLLLIGFVSKKRAVWFIMPIILTAIIFYVSKRRIPRNALIVVLIIPLTFYLGVRLNRTLNKEHKVWGSFDLEYVMNYAREYTFGINEDNPEIELGHGRGGATLLLLQKLADEGLRYQENILGYGFDEIYTKSYEQFDNEKFGIINKGSATGFFQSYITNGLLGIITFLLYVYTLLSFIKIKRLRILIILIFLWEYFLYTGILFRIQPLTIMLMYIIIYSNHLYTNKQFLNQYRPIFRNTE